MKGIPEELLYVLFFAAIMLIQYLIQRNRGADRQQDTPEELSQHAQDLVLDELPEPPPTLMPPPSPAASHRLREAVPRGPTMARHPAPRPAKRFSRSALFGGKRRTQDAVVAAAILGPCRAFVPHDTGQ